MRTSFLMYGFLLGCCFALVTGCFSVSDRYRRVDSVTRQEAEYLRILAVKETLRKEGMLGRVAFRLRKANVMHCKSRVAGALGVVFFNQTRFSDDLQEAARSLGFSRLLKVVHRYSGSPAEKVGLKPGDMILKVNGIDLSEREASKTLLGSALVAPIRQGVRLQLVVRRQKKQISMDVQPEMLCDLAIFMDQNESIDAYVDDGDIFITTGMMRFLKSEDELAWIIAHEMAHVLHNIYYMGIEGEKKADYWATRYTLRAGYDPEKIVQFWQRLAAEEPNEILFSQSGYPSAAERIVVVKRALAELMTEQ
ncbi:M48 family metalloprotease [Magnetococcales bacterium HHB-1]